MSQQINLFNPVFLKQKKIFTTQAMAQALVVLLAGLGAFVGYVSYTVNALEADSIALDAQVKRKEEQLKEVIAQFPPRQRSEALAAAIQHAELQIGSMSMISTVLNTGEVGNTNGFGAYFNAFARQGIEGLWLTGIDIEDAGQGVSLRGRALQAELIPVYIARLAKEPVLKGKTFSSLQIRQPAPAAPGQAPAQARTVPYVEFSLRARPEEEPK